MKKYLFLGCSILFLSACGGSSSSEPPVVEPEVPSQPDPTPDPDPAPEPEPTIAEPLFPPNLAVTTCSGLDYIQVVSATSDDNTNSAFLATNVIDGQLTRNGSWITELADATVTLDLGFRYQVKQVGSAWLNGEQAINSFDIEFSEDGIDFETIASSVDSSGETAYFDLTDTQDMPARFIRIKSKGSDTDGRTELAEVAVMGCPLDVDVAPIAEQSVDIAQFNLDPNVPPGSNFDLLSWALDTPEVDPNDGFSLRASERQLDAGYVSDQYFYTAEDGGMVFVATVDGAKTSANTSFTRSELRGMLRRGDTSIRTQGVNENNWILGYQPDPQTTVGGRGGRMTATLKVDEVTTTGSQLHEGRVIVGQIHADDDEPIRLYYKKFENNERGYIYFAHELRGGDDLWLMVVGDELNTDQSHPTITNNPSQGIALGEVFSYEIDQRGARIDVIIRRGDLNGPIIGYNYVDMNERGSGYDIIEEWNYFKAGAYSQNNTGDGDDFSKVTFYQLNTEYGPQ
jgi:poly(beta-D-mannuronate) lyase